MRYLAYKLSIFLVASSVSFAQSATDADRINQMKAIILRINAVHKSYEEIRKGAKSAAEKAIKEAGPGATPERIAEIKVPFDKHLEDINAREVKEIKELEDKLAAIQNPPALKK